MPSPGLGVGVLAPMSRTDIKIVITDTKYICKTRGFTQLGFFPVHDH